MITIAQSLERDMEICCYKVLKLYMKWYNISLDGRLWQVNDMNTINPNITTKIEQESVKALKHNKEY